MLLFGFPREIVDHRGSLDRKESNFMLKDPKNLRSVHVTVCPSILLSDCFIHVLPLKYFRENQVKLERKVVVDFL